MIYILKIGYMTFALPNNKGLSTVIETMARARMIRTDDRYCKGGLELEDGFVKCSVECEHAFSFGSKRADREVIEPEVMPRQGKGEGDAMFALRASRALTCGSKKAVTGELRRMLREGGAE
jgi:hypothetical protein